MNMEKLSIREVSAQFEIGDHAATRWESSHLIEGLTIERRAHCGKGYPAKFPKEIC